MKINRACPSCKSLNSIVLEKSKLYCNSDSCDFEYHYKCPLCEANLNDSHFSNDEQGECFDCPSCKAKIHSKRIQNIFNNLMQISYDTRCKLCNGPTMYRSQANMGHRCFFFPKCSGQANLFSSKKESLIFLDFETTGLNAAKDYIIEIGALKIDEDGFEHTFDTFVKPPISLPEKITKITNITNDMLVDAPELEEVVHNFQEFIGDATIIAHNAEFDVPWLIINFEKYKLKLNGNRIICTLNWARKMQEARCSLSALTKKYNIGHLNAHRALADAAVTKELFFIYDAIEEHGTREEPIDRYMGIVTKLQKNAAKKKLAAS